MTTIIDSAPASITIPRGSSVDVVIVAHNDDGAPAVLGAMDVVVGDQTVHIEATVPAVDATPVTFGPATLTSDLAAAGVTVVNLGSGLYRVHGPAA